MPRTLKNRTYMTTVTALGTPSRLHPFLGDRIQSTATWTKKVEGRKVAGGLQGFP